MTAVRRADIAFAIAIATGLLFVALLGPLDRRLEMAHTNDFSGFWAVGRAVDLGVDPYDPTQWSRVADAVGWPAPSGDTSVPNYMPWTALFLAAVALMPIDVAAWVWMALGVAFATLAVMRGAGRPPRSTHCEMKGFRSLPAASEAVLGTDLATFEGLAKYRLASGTARPFLALGPSFRLPNGPDGDVRSVYGVTLGAGLEIRANRIKISPTVRYTRWGPDRGPASSGDPRNRMYVLVGVSF